MNSRTFMIHILIVIAIPVYAADKQDVSVREKFKSYLKDKYDASAKARFAVN